MAIVLNFLATSGLLLKIDFTFFLFLQLSLQWRKCKVYSSIGKLHAVPSTYHCKAVFRCQQHCWTFFWWILWCFTQVAELVCVKIFLSVEPQTKSVLNLNLVNLSCVVLMSFDLVLTKKIMFTAWLILQ